MVMVIEMEMVVVVATVSAMVSVLTVEILEVVRTGLEWSW